MKQALIGIIGGTGLGQALGALGGGETVAVETPFGPPSSPIVRTDVQGVQVALLSRHGEGHLLNPSRVPYRANIFALKSIGVTHILASAAVGSLREENCGPSMHTYVPREWTTVEAFLPATSSTARSEEQNGAANST